MKLLQEIIELLSDEGRPLSASLLKIKVLLHQIGQPELGEWTTYELSGYPANIEVPEYRKLRTTVRANMIAPGATLKGHPLSISHIPAEHHKIFETIEYRLSISVLEKALTQESAALRVPLPSEFHWLLAEQFNDGVEILSAWLAADTSQVVHALSSVRSRLLDFTLKLQSQIPDSAEGKEVRSAANSVDIASMFSNAILGDGNTFIFGQDNTVTISKKIHRGNFSELAEALRAEKVGEADIKKLGTAIELDSTSSELGEKKFGPRVKDWIGEMLKKSVDAAWQVELGIAGGLLTNYLQAYYFGHP